MNGLSTRCRCRVLVASVALLLGARAYADVLPSDRAAIAHDKAIVSARYGNCAAFDPTGCHPGAFALPDGFGNRMYVIALWGVAGDACYRGIAYFFDGERLLGNSSILPPRSSAGVVGVHAVGAGKVAILYAVSTSRNVSCAANGNAGTVTYIYDWNGSRFQVISGTPPPPPKWIVGTF